MKTKYAKKCTTNFGNIDPRARAWNLARQVIQAMDEVGLKPPGFGFECDVMHIIENGLAKAIIDVIGNIRRNKREAS